MNQSTTPEPIKTIRLKELHDFAEAFLVAGIYMGDLTKPSTGRKTPAIHLLKLQQPYYDEVVNGNKKAETRYDDRGFSVNDILVLQEVKRNSDTAGEAAPEWLLTGKKQIVRVTHLVNLSEGPLAGEVKDGIVVLSFEKITTKASEAIKAIKS